MSFIYHQMEITKQFQGIVPLGYIYLVLLGILNQSFYYNQLGVDILSYSSITDVLIGPIAQLTSSFFSISTFLFVLLILFNLPSWLIKFKEQEWFVKLSKISPEISVAETKEFLLQRFLIFLALALLVFFLGNGLGQGYILSSKIKDKKILYEDKITFVNDKEKPIHIIGKNSAYIFYIEENQQEVMISPLHSGLVKSLVEKN